MSLFKDMRTMQKMSKETSREWDPGAQLRDSLARLHQTTQSLNAQAAAANQAHGVQAQATITQVAGTGTYFNLEPVLAISVLVDLPGGPPIPTVVRSPVPLAELANLQPGRAFTVRINPSAPQEVSPLWGTPA